MGRVLFCKTTQTRLMPDGAATFWFVTSTPCDSNIFLTRVFRFGLPIFAVRSPDRKIDATFTPLKLRLKNLLTGTCRISGGYFKTVLYLADRESNTVAFRKWPRDFRRSKTKKSDSTLLSGFWDKKIWITFHQLASLSFPYFFKWIIKLNQDATLLWNIRGVPKENFFLKKFCY